MEKQKRCIIVGAGDFFGFPILPEEGDFLMAADAGYQVLKAAGIKPDLVVGDFDSMRVAGIKGVTGPLWGLDIYEDAQKASYLQHLTRFLIDGVEARAIDPIKNDPDLLACIRIGLEKGYKEFHLLGATGQRMDHSIANQQILGFLSEQGAQGYLYGETQVIMALTNGCVRFGPEKTGYLSVFAFTEKAEGVTETGLKYILHDACLNNVTPTGVSNEFVGQEAEVSVKKGTLLLVYDF